MAATPRLSPGDPRLDPRLHTQACDFRDSLAKLRRDLGLDQPPG